MEDIPAAEGDSQVAEEDIPVEGDSLAAANNPVEDNQAAESIPAADRAEAEQILKSKKKVMTLIRWLCDFTLLVLIHFTFSYLFCSSDCSVATNK